MKTQHEYVPEELSDGLVKQHNRLPRERSGRYVLRVNGFHLAHTFPIIIKLSYVVHLGILYEIWTPDNIFSVIPRACYMYPAQ